MRKIFTEIEFALLYIVSHLPLWFFYFISDIFALLLCYVIRYRYTTIITNISRSFPELKYKEVKELARDYYFYMSDIIFESVWDISHSKEAVCKVAECEETSIADKFQQRYGRVLILLGHCGNFELIGGINGKNLKSPDYDKKRIISNPMYAAYKEAESETADLLINKLREHEYKKFGNTGGLVESKRIIRHIIRNKEEKASYFFIADQNPIGDHHIVVNFLNQPTMMLSGPEYVATTIGMPVVYLYIDRVERGKYKMHFTEITEDARKEEPGFVTKRFAELLEKDIKRNRVNWLWSHRRWKREIVKSDEKNC